MNVDHFMFGLQMSTLAGLLIVRAVQLRWQRRKLAQVEAKRELHVFGDFVLPCVEDPRWTYNGYYFKLGNISVVKDRAYRTNESLWWAYVVHIDREIAPLDVEQTHAFGKALEARFEQECVDKLRASASKTVLGE